MDFQVNEQTYFLSLAEDAKQWEVFVSTPAGAMSIPVYVDAAESESLVVIQRGEREAEIGELRPLKNVIALNCHPERSECFAKRNTDGVEGPLATKR